MAFRRPGFFPGRRRDFPGFGFFRAALVSRVCGRRERRERDERGDASSVAEGVQRDARSDDAAGPPGGAPRKPSFRKPIRRFLLRFAQAAARTVRVEHVVLRVSGGFGR